MEFSSSEGYSGLIQGLSIRRAQGAVGHDDDVLGVRQYWISLSWVRYRRHLTWLITGLFFSSGLFYSLSVWKCLKLEMPRAFISHQLSTSSSLTSQASKNVILLIRALPLSSLGSNSFLGWSTCDWWIRQSSFRSMKVLWKTQFSLKAGGPQIAGSKEPTPQLHNFLYHLLLDCFSHFTFIVICIFAVNVTISSNRGYLHSFLGLA